MTDLILDCKNLNCPMPIVKLCAAINKLDAGQTLEIEATDPAFQPDLVAWAKKTGNDIESFESGAVQRAVIRKQ